DAAAAGPRTLLKRGWCPGRAPRSGWNDSGDGSREAPARPRRAADRPAPHLRCAGHAFPRGPAAPRPQVPALRDVAHDHGSGDPPQRRGGVRRVGDRWSPRGRGGGGLSQGRRLIVAPGAPGDLLELLVAELVRIARKLGHFVASGAFIAGAVGNESQAESAAHRWRESTMSVS